MVVLNEIDVYIKKSDLNEWLKSLEEDLFKVEVETINGSERIKIWIVVNDKNFSKVLEHLGIRRSSFIEATDAGMYIRLRMEMMCSTLRSLHGWILQVRKYHEKYLRRLAEFLRKVEDGEVEVYEP